MKEITKIKPIRLDKLNNAEFANFAKRFINLVYEAKEGDVPATGRELGIDPADLAEFEEEYAAMTDIVVQTRTSTITAQMKKLDKERNDLIVFILNHMRSWLLTPIEEQRLAAIELFNVLKPYVGTCRLPKQQKTATIEALAVDLNKPETVVYVRKFALYEVLEKLTTTNDAYATLTAQRTDAMSRARREDSKTVRARMYKLYEVMCDIAYIESVSNPSDVKSNFVRSLNAMIDETLALYNQRRAQQQKPAKEEVNE